MLEKRKLHEIKIIIVLAILSLVFYVGAAILTVVTGSGENESLGEAFHLGESVKSVTVETEEALYHLEKDKIDWYSPEAEGVALDQVAVGNITDLFTYVEPDRIISDGTAYFEQFGLDNPQYRLIASGDSAEKVYLIGSFNAILQQYYVAVEGEPAVYLAAKRDVENSMRSLLQLVDAPELSATQSSVITKLSFEGTDDSFTAAKENEVFVYEKDGETYEGDAYSALDVYYTLKNVAYDNCVTFDASDEELAAYGLKEPEIQVALTLEGEAGAYLVKVGRGEDGNYYLSSGAERIVYQITEEEYQQLDEDTHFSNLVE